MKPYACFVVPPEDLALFNKIEKIVQELPELDLGKENGRKTKVSCHMLGRALANFFPVKCHDGYFMDCCRHSWLTTASGLIVDAYPVAVVGGPLLIETRFGIPWGSFYKEERLQCLENDSFLNHARIVTEAVGLIIKQVA